jgi:hypothetical protein
MMWRVSIGIGCMRVVRVTVIIVNVSFHIAVDVVAISMPSWVEVGTGRMV